jgi:pilus assembly protein CpaE
MEKRGKLISILSTKGGVGKTVFLLNMAGIFCSMNKKVLILDMDLCSGGIGLSLGVNPKKNIYNLVDDLNNNKFKEIDNYIAKYNENIDVIISPIDPRESLRINRKSIETIFNNVAHKYDVVLIDTNHILNDNNVSIIDKSDISLLIITNDPIDLKNAKSLLSIFKDIKKTNYKIILNCSRDTDKDYLSTFDIKHIIKDNIDYTIASSFHIRSIDKYTLSAEILTLNSYIRAKKKADIKKFTLIAKDLIKGD